MKIVQVQQVIGKVVGCLLYLLQHSLLRWWGTELCNRNGTDLAGFSLPFPSFL